MLAQSPIGICRRINCEIGKDMFECPTFKILWALSTTESDIGGCQSPIMSLACLVCHGVESPSPSHSFRSYSVSSAENEGRCHAIVNCITRKSSLPLSTVNSFRASSSSKVTPQPTVTSNNEMPGTPRLVRSCAVRRDLVRDWNFDEVAMDH